MMRMTIEVKYKNSKCELVTLCFDRKTNCGNVTYIHVLMEASTPVNTNI